MLKIKTIDDELYNIFKNYKGKYLALKRVYPIKDEGFARIWFITDVKRIGTYKRATIYYRYADTKNRIRKNNQTIIKHLSSFRFEYYILTEKEVRDINLLSKL